ncbi:MAG: lipoprotein-releasing ABC transporter permease subunit [Gammaproteobacteria bacterium]|nr:lipoprotein-releasing ABC transporter permease subunit [Gammaproteobacteria bacterium]
MFRPLPVFIGFRYTRAKKRNHFISFISIISVLGIALGVAVLITVLSVMNGFDYQIKTHIFSLANQVTVNDLTGSVSDWRHLNRQVTRAHDIVATAPFVTGQGMLTNSGTVHGVMVTGVMPKLENKVSIVGAKMLRGSLNALQPGKFGIVVGTTLADALNLYIGDKVTLLTPKASLSPFGVLPRYKRFTVVGIFHVGGASGFDSSVAYINLTDAQKLFEMGGAVSGLRLKINDLYAAPKVTSELAKRLPRNYVVSNWTQQYGTLFKAIRMEKTMMFVILMFIIAVAAFNLVSMLVMVVTDKQSDIAILRTLGASPRMIMGIFMVQGSIIGFLGTFFGVVAGILLATYAPNIVAGIQSLFHVQFISASVYFIDYLPSKLDWMNVLHVSIAALGMSLVATIYPAWRASRVKPAEALRYE